MKIIQNGYKLTSDFKTFPTQFSENVEVQFIRDKKFSEAFIQPFIAYGKGRIHVLAPTILEDDTIVFPKEVFVDSGEIALSVSVEANNKIENTEVLAIRVLKSAGLENVLPENKDTWQTVLKNYLMQELKLNINPRIETIVNETERLQNNTALLQDEIAKLIKESNDKVNKLISDVTKMVNDGEFDGSTIMNGEGVPSDSIGKENDLYINRLSEGDFAQFLFIKTNGVWIPQFKVSGRDGTDSLPIKGSMFLPEDLVTAPGYIDLNEYYFPAEYIGIDDNTTLPDVLNNADRRITNLEEKKIVLPTQLVINGDFQINQRGFYEYSSINGSSKFTLDMWRILTSSSGNLKIIVKDNGVTLQNSKGDGVLTQKVNLLNINNYTVCFNANNVVGDVKLQIYRSDSSYIEYEILNGVNTIYIKDSDIRDVSFLLIGTSSVDIEYIDLFEGDIAYPHVKEDYSIALMRCRQFIKPIIIGYTTYVSAISISVCFNVDLNMYSIPTLTLTNEGALENINTVTYVAINKDSIRFAIGATQVGMARVYNRTYIASCESL